MVRFRVLVFVALVFCGSFLTAFQEAGYAAVSANDYTGFAGKNLRLAVETGDVFDKIAQEVFAPCTPVYFTTMTEAFTAVENGQADAVVLGSSYYGALKDAGVYGRFAYYELPPDRYLLSYAQVFNRASLRDEWNAWLAQKTADGSLQKRFAFWTENALPAPEQIPAYRFTGEKGVLRVCDTGNYPPFSYLIANGGHAGYDNDLVNWFASENGYTPQWTYMAYDALVPYVSSGKADMSGASFVNTEERTRQLIFGQPTAWIRVVVAAARKTEAEAARQTAISSRADGLTLDDFIGRKFAIQQGTVYETLAKGLFQDQSPLYFDDTAAMFEAVRLGKADATLYNSVTAKEFIENAGGDLVSVPVPQDIFNAPSGVISMNGELLGKYNAFLAQIKADGTLAAMNRRWFDQFDQNAPPAMPDIPLSGENGVLKVAVTADQMPFTLIVNGEVSGFEIEHMTRFAQYLGMKPEFSVMQFGGLLPAVASGKCDVGVACISITEERAKSVRFSDSYYAETAVLIYRAPAAEAAQGFSLMAWEDFIGKTFAIQQGTVYETLAKGLFQDQSPLYFDDTAAMFEAVRLGKAEATLYTSVTAKEFIENAGGELTSVPVPQDIFSAPSGVISMNEKLLGKYNAFLAQIKADGTLDDMNRRWFDQFDQNAPPAMPDIPLSGENGVLKVAVTADQMPFTLIVNGEVSGFEIEHMTRFAQYLGMKPEFSVMQFGGLLPAVASGKCDVGVACISITEERAKSVHFSDSYYAETAVLIYRAPAAEAAQGFSLTAWVKDAIHKNLIIEDRWKLIVGGLGVTMQISLLSQLFSTLLAVPVCYVLTRRSRLVRRIGKLYCGFIYGLPALTLLLISYYIVFGHSDINPVYIAVAAFSLICAAEIAGNFAQSIDTVNKTEVEAARAIGFSSIAAFWLIVFPQALKRALPSYTVGFVMLVKATAVVGYIAIQDMTRAADIIRSRTFDAYFPILFTALIYLIITTMCVLAFNFILKRFNGEVTLK